MVNGVNASQGAEIGVTSDCGNRGHLTAEIGVTSDYSTFCLPTGWRAVSRELDEDDL